VVASLADSPRSRYARLSPHTSNLTGQVVFNPEQDRHLTHGASHRASTQQWFNWPISLADSNFVPLSWLAMSIKKLTVRFDRRKYERSLGATDMMATPHYNHRGVDSRHYRRHARQLVRRPGVFADITVPRTDMTAVLAILRTTSGLRHTAHDSRS
jgi:hypothetical protein